jgi:hypothetical protein
MTTNDAVPTARISEEQHRCRNCGTDAPGAYCPACGQETTIEMPTARKFLRDAAGRYVALDGRLWRTLQALLFRPGFLTREYFAGRRRRYIRPGRLFLVLSLVAFAALRLFADEPVRLDAEPTVPAAAGTKKRANATIDAGAIALRFDDDLNFRFEGGDATIAGTLNKRADRFNRLPREDKIDQIFAGVVRYGPYAMFALLPAYALLLQLVYVGRAGRYPGRPNRYAEHLVFGAHTHAFLFLALLLTAIPWPPLRGALWLWVILYFLWSMKAVYRGRWSGVLARALVIFVGYLALFGLAMAGLLIAAVFLR